MSRTAWLRTHCFLQWKLYTVIKSSEICIRKHYHTWFLVIRWHCYYEESCIINASGHRCFCTQATYHTTATAEERGKKKKKKKRGQKNPTTISSFTLNSFGWSQNSLHPVASSLWKKKKSGTEKSETTVHSNQLVERGLTVTCNKLAEERSTLGVEWIRKEEKEDTRIKSPGKIWLTRITTF